MRRENNLSILFTIITMGILIGVYCFYRRGELISMKQMIILCFLEVIACCCSFQMVHRQNKKNYVLYSMMIACLFLLSHCNGFSRGIVAGVAVEPSVLTTLMGQCIAYLVIGMIVPLAWWKVKETFKF